MRMIFTPVVWVVVVFDGLQPGRFVELEKVWTTIDNVNAAYPHAESSQPAYEKYTQTSLSDGHVDRDENEEYPRDEDCVVESLLGYRRHRSH